MSDDNQFRFKEVDELIRQQISYLELGDECAFLGEYAAGQGWSYSETNSIIWNLKKKSGQGGFHYKRSAIERVAQLYAHGFKLEILKDYVLVPVPPSSAKGDSAYDSRMLDILNHLNVLSGGVLDVRELVVQQQSTMPSHLSEVRLNPTDLVRLYAIDETVVQQKPIHNGIIIFDDLLTTGAHFKAMQSVLRQRFTHSRIIGVFFARSIHV